jgi:hypothetical protein
MDPWGATDALMSLPRRFLPSCHYLRTFCVCCDTSPSGTLNLLRKICIGAGQTITNPDEMIIHEFFIRNRDITLLIPRDLSCLSSMITISCDGWDN